MMMVTYEVTAKVRADLVEQYESYMRLHIPDVLATGKFVAATFARAPGGHYRARYEAADQQSLDRYLAEDTARLRADFASHFPNGVELSREVWDTLQSWP
jgi:hypothetical protein